MNKNFPVRASLKLICISSGFVATSAMLVSLLSIIYSEEVYTGVSIKDFLPNDFVNIVFIPVLFILSITLCVRKNILGLFTLAASLFYVLYVYFAYTFGIKPTVMFLPYLLLVSSSLYTLIIFLTKIDYDKLKFKHDLLIKKRIFASILMILAILLLTRQTYVILTAIKTLKYNQTDVSLWAADFILGVPVLMICSIMLFQNKQAGYFFASVVFLVFAVLCLALIPIFIIQSIGEGEFDVISTIVLCVSTVVCSLPFYFLYRSYSN